MDKGNRTWQKPKTVILYLNPCADNRIVCMQPDFKITCQSADPSDLVGAGNAFGLCFLEEQECRNFDWEKTHFILREDGAPIHIAQQQGQLYTANLEAFCSCDGQKEIYASFQVENVSASARNFYFSFMPRSGNEKYITNINHEGYASYSPNINLYTMLPSDWHFSPGRMWDDSYIFDFVSDDCVSVSFVDRKNTGYYDNRNYCDVIFSLLPGETGSLCFRISSIHDSKNDTYPFNYALYDKAKNDTILSWLDITSQIVRYPCPTNSYLNKMTRHLVVQCMQMMHRYGTNKGLITRQGNLCKWIWPWEASEFLTAFDRMGLQNYSREAYRYYFQEYQVKEGQDKGKIRTVGIEWAALTGAVIDMVSQHILICQERKVFDEFHKALIDGFTWIESRRAETIDNPAYPEIGQGLFPGMRATDWAGETQNWCFTDAVNVHAYQTLNKMLDEFGDNSNAKKVRSARQSYMERMQHTLEQLSLPYKDSDEVFLTNVIGKEIKDPPTHPYFSDGPAYLIRYGIIDPASEIALKIENYFRNRHLFQRGLTGAFQCSTIEHFASDEHAGHVWYVTASEIAWFYAWLATGRRDQARQTLYALFEYAMSDEFCFIERYADNDPSYVPWQPNASANGRVLNMMLDYYSPG